MIEVITLKKSLKVVHFEDLCVGDVYRDRNGYLCIKINDDYDNNNLTYGFENQGGGWATTGEDALAEVTPLKATLTISEE